MRYNSNDCLFCHSLAKPITFASHQLCNITPAFKHCNVLYAVINKPAYAHAS